MRIFLQFCTSGSINCDEVKKSQEAVKTAEPTIFSKILNKSIPADIIYEDDKVILLYDLYAPKYYYWWLHLQLNIVNFKCLDHVDTIYVYSMYVSDTHTYCMTEENSVYTWLWQYM